MTDPRYIGTVLYVGLSIFAALLAAGLMMQERRYSVRRTALTGWAVSEHRLPHGGRFIRPEFFCPGRSYSPERFIFFPAGGYPPC